MGKFCGYHLTVLGGSLFLMRHQLRVLCFASILFGCTLAAPGQLRAQIRKACETGITLKLNASITTQGSLILAEIISTKPLPDLSAEWDGKPTPLWNEGDTKKTLHALLGVDLEKAPGKYDWKV